MHHNGRAHLLLAERPGWHDALLDKVDVDCGLRLVPAPSEPRPLVDDAGAFAGLTLPTGIATDADGAVYLVDAGTHEIKRLDPCTGAFTSLPCIGGRGSEPRMVRDPRGIAISPRGVLYVCDTGNRRVQAFTLAALALRAIWGPLRLVPGTPPSVERVAPERLPTPAHGEACLPDNPVFGDGTWEPFDVVVDAECAVYVSDRANGAVHRFDRHGAWSSAILEAEPGVPLGRPTHLAMDRNGRLYVAQEGDPGVLVFPPDGGPAERIEPPAELDDRFCPSGIAVAGDGTVYVSDHRAGCMFRCLPPDERPRLPIACPETLGAPVALAFDAAGDAIMVDGASNRVLCFEPHVAFEHEGRFVSDALDSGIRRCRWHRLALESVVPRGCSIRVDTFTSDAPKPRDEMLSLPEDRWHTGALHATAGEGDWDCLVMSPPGRYAWVRLTLRGDGSATPVVAAMRAHYPRTSSLRFLPATYAEDPVSADFLGRFLSIFDTVAGGVSERIASFASVLDPGAAPADPPAPGAVDFLTWIASWLDMALQRHWPEQRRRDLLRYAHLLYRRRGTVDGLRLHVRLLTGIEPFVLEHYKLRPWAFVGSARAGEGTRVWGNEIVRRLKLDEYSAVGSFQLLEESDPRLDPLAHVANRFTVFVPIPGGGTESEQENVRWVVETAKPAHTHASVVFVEPRFAISPELVLGMNTMLRRPPDATVTGASRLRMDAGIGENGDATAPALRIGKRARVGFSTIVD